MSELNGCMNKRVDLWTLPEVMKHRHIMPTTLPTSILQAAFSVCIVSGEHAILLEVYHQSSTGMKLRPWTLGSPTVLPHTHQAPGKMLAMPIDDKRCHCPHCIPYFTKSSCILRNKLVFHRIVLYFTETSRVLQNRLLFCRIIPQWKKCYVPCFFSSDWKWRPWRE